ncbi:MAG: O-antigen polysaccharide polymerase Wzy family protein [Firmicutes bacterium]|nr:O-antigen polysaccharide polymerase Wzy family protein [Bacillota bacterium]
MSSLKVHAKTIAAAAIVTVLVLVLSLTYHFDTLLTVCLLIWAAAFIVYLANLGDNIAFFCFMISFFVFLLGRQVVYSLFERKEVYTYLDVTNDQTYTLLITALVFLCIGSRIGSYKVRLAEGTSRWKSFLDTPDYGRNYSTACKIMFYVCYVFSVASVILHVLYVRRVGYLASYTTQAGGAGVPTFVSYFASFAPVALSLYLATFPSKKASMRALVLYEIYGVLTVFTGQRYPFIGISMFVLSYMFIRNRKEKGWIKKRYYAYVIIAIPVLMILFTAYDSIRQGKAFDFKSTGETVITFFDQQGGSINTIRRTIYNAEQLQDMHLVSLSGTYSAVFENFISRALFGIETFSGNSVARAMAGHDLSARLSWIAYGNGYLSGMGTGSSYIAELFHDFGAVGVAAGSLFYGFALSRISRLEKGNKLLGGIALAMMYYLFLAPRGSFDAFIGGIFRIYSIFLFLVIIVMSWFLSGRIKYRSGSTKRKNA